MMKKFICILLMLLLTVSVCACAGAKEPNAEQTGSAVSENSTSKAASGTTSIDEMGASIMQRQIEYLLSENEDLKAQTTSLRVDNGELEEQVSSLQDDLDTLLEQDNVFMQAAGVCTDIFSIDYFRRFITIENKYAEDHLYYELYYMDDDAKVPKLILRNYRRFWNVSASPNGKKVLFNDFEVEAGGSLYLYDIEAETASKIDFKGILEEYHYAHYAGWLDDRYFLFTEGMDYPSIYGGNIYVYDTQTNICRELIKTENRDMEIRRFSIYNRNESWQEEQKQSIFFEIVFSENANFVEERYVMLPVSEIRDAIEKQSTVTIKAKETF